MGDFFKDLGHYEEEGNPGMGFYRSAKYLDRLLDCVILLSQKIKDEPYKIELKSVPTAPKTMKGNLANLINASKGPLFFKDDQEQPLTGKALQHETEAYSIAEANRILPGTSSLAQLRAKFRNLTTKINAQVRNAIMAEMEASKDQENAYFQ